MPILPAPRTPTRLNSILRSSSPHGVISSLLTPQSGCRGRRFAVRLSERRTQFGGEKRHRRTLEQTDDRQGLFQLFLDHGNHLDGSERRSARLEEVVVHADSRPAQNLSPYVRKRRFQRAARCYVHCGMERLLPEPVFLNGLCKPVDVVQVLANPLQALGPVSDTECQMPARGREFFRVDGCRYLVRDRRLFVGIVFDGLPERSAGKIQDVPASFRY